MNSGFMTLNELKPALDKTISHLKDELSQIRTGRATAELLEPVKVDAYGTTNQLKALGNISVSDARTLLVQVWDKSVVDDVMRGIQSANLGFGVSQDGDMIRVTVPELNEERRKDLVKVMKERVEVARISIRNVRQKFMKDIEDAVEGGISEDEGKRMKEQVEKEVKATNSMVEELKDLKEKDLMTV